MEGENSTTPETAEEKIARLEEAYNLLLEQVEDLSAKAYFNKPTGLMSRLAFDEEMERRNYDIFKQNDFQEKRGSANKTPENIVLAIFDIDKFKDVNDVLGHDAGDVVLKIVAQTIQSYVRKTDMVARWGGEEIVITFDGATLEGAELKANFIREKVSEIVFEEFPELKVTVSAGLANSTDFNDMKSFFVAADTALYESKHSGRNKVTIYSELPEVEVS